MSLSDKARTALRAAYASKGPHRGQLLAKCPKSNTLAAAAWQGAMLVCNPYKASIGALLFMTDEQKDVRDEIVAHFDKLPREFQILAQRDREALEALGVFLMTFNQITEMQKLIETIARMDTPYDNLAHDTEENREAIAADLDDSELCSDAQALYDLIATAREILKGGRK